MTRKWLPAFVPLMLILSASGAKGQEVAKRAKDGMTPLLGVSDDRIAILLLRAGADPHAKDGDGTVRDQARFWHWPQTLACLDQHGMK
jgi:hypothetical protein